jgi:polyferredoxin
MSPNNWWSEKGESVIELLFIFVGIILMLCFIAVIIALEVAFWYVAVWVVLFIFAVKTTWWAMLILAVVIAILEMGLTNRLKPKDKNVNVNISTGGSDYDFK